MTLFSLRSSPPVFLGILGIAVSLCLLGFAGFFLFQEPKVPARYLPAGRTVALFTKMEPEELKRFATWFPALNAALEKPVEAIAIIRSPQNTLELIQFDTRDLDTGKMGPFAVYGTADPLMMLAQKNEKNLLSSPAFRALQTGHTDTESWAFVDLAILPEPSTSLKDQILMTGLEGHTHLAFLQNAGMEQIRFYGKETESTGFISDTIEGIPSPTIQLKVTGGALLWAALTEDLARDPSLLLKTLGTTHAERLFGADTSFVYDLLPLFEASATLSLTSPSGSGNVLYILQGEVDADLELTALLERVRQSAASTLSSSSIVQRSFDERFSSRIIQASDESLEQKEERINGWTVQTVTVGSGAGILTAKRGKEFMISNDFAQAQDLLQRQPTNAKQIHLPRSKGSSVISLKAGGIIQSSTLESFFSSQSDYQRMIRVLLPQTDKPILWSIEQSGLVTTINFSN